MQLRNWTGLKELELLAPARTADIGIAAIDCGADAVYIAGPEFGARQAAGNPVDDIRRLCDYAHRFGVRIFAALNTIVYDDELPRALRMMKEMQDAGADAIIIQDLGLTGPARRLAGCADNLEIPLHASTQCAVRTPEKARFLESLGFERLILERGLSLDRIREIRAAVGCELEFFVHGALCVCYSGQCYISENIARRSANRGACIQACRSLYNLTDSEGNILVSNQPLLSLKDFNLKSRLKDLADAGISSFKIEGRLKNISYVRNIVREYSMALDSIVEKYPDRYRRASYGEVSGGFSPEPDKTFNRGYTELFLDGRRGLWASGGAAKSMGEEAGVVEKISPDKSVFTLRPARPGLRFGNGDGFCFVTDRQKVVGFRADVCEGMTVRCKPVPELSEGVMLYRNIDQAFERKLETELPRRQIGVELSISSSGDGPALAVSALSEDGRSWSGILGEGAEPALNQEKMHAALVVQLSKSAEHYAFSVRSIESDSLPFLPVSAVNAFRRRIARELDNIPCVKSGLHGNGASHAEDISEGAACPGIPSFFPKGQRISYRANVANSLSRNLFSSLGAGDIEQAYELQRKPGAELMRTKYCIRYQYGHCPKYHKDSWPSGLFLENNGRLFPLEFDCKACEMSVLAPDSSISKVMETSPKRS